MPNSPRRPLVRLLLIGFFATGIFNLLAGAANLCAAPDLSAVNFALAAVLLAIWTYGRG